MWTWPSREVLLAQPESVLPAGLGAAWRLVTSPQGSPQRPWRGAPGPGEASSPLQSPECASTPAGQLTRARESVSTSCPCGLVGPLATAQAS